MTIDQRALVEDLDSRQNDVLRQLADLNDRIETLLNQCLVARQQALDAVQASATPLASGTDGQFNRGDPNVPTYQSRVIDVIPAAR